jgi:hypothetical protein
MIGRHYLNDIPLWMLYLYGASCDIMIRESGIWNWKISVREPTRDQEVWQ